MVAKREYFYRIDSEGRLLHEGTELTDAYFLDFFFRQLQPNQTGSRPEFTYVSPCGREMNYVECNGLPIVFRSLLSPESSDRTSSLLFAGTLRIPFHPEGLFFNQATGELQHPVEGLAGKRVTSIRMGRLGRHVLIELGRYIHEDGKGFLILWQGKELTIRNL